MDVVCILVHFIDVAQVYLIALCYLGEDDFVASSLKHLMLLRYGYFGQFVLGGPVGRVGILDERVKFGRLLSGRLQCDRGVICLRLS